MTESGALVQLKPNIVLQNFKSYNLLLFYTINSKSLYNWTGRKANQTLIGHIENAEQLILKMHPGMTVLRHITIREQDKNSIQNFLDDIGISLQDYKDRLRLWREFEISVYSDIQKLKIAENNHLMLNKLDKAIDVSAKIQELARTINDVSLVKEKEQLILETTEKLESNTHKNEILTEINQLIPKLNKCVTTKDVETAVSIYNQITLLYRSINEQPSKSHREIIQSYENFYNEWEKEVSS
ncbi:MAG: hypothetical protein ACTSRD_10315 [Promethearchaeota archaeon]